MMEGFIPVLDLSEDSPDRQAEIVKSALGSIGFLEVRGSKISHTEVSQIFDYSRELFAQPVELKSRFAADEAGRGYLGLKTQMLGLDRKDFRETFQYGRGAALKTQELPPPFDAPEVEATIEQFHKDLHETSHQLLVLFATALHLPYEHFKSAHSFGLNTGISLIHYPPISPSDRLSKDHLDIRAGAQRLGHLDLTSAALMVTRGGQLTQLEVFQEPTDQPGLQIYIPRAVLPRGMPITDTLNKSEYPTEGEWAWVDVPIPPSGSFYVNVGLAMELWSGGAYKAVLHRVMFPAPSIVQGEQSPDRYTLALFVQPDDDVEIRAVRADGQLDTTKAPMNAGDLFNTKLQESMKRQLHTVTAAA